MSWEKKLIEMRQLEGFMDATNGKPRGCKGMCGYIDYNMGYDLGLRVRKKGIVNIDDYKPSWE